jgi:hypothetical protein
MENNSTILSVQLLIPIQIEVGIDKNFKFEKKKMGKKRFVTKNGKMKIKFWLLLVMAVVIAIGIGIGIGIGIEKGSFFY